MSSANPITGSPTAAQASQRKAGPACFVIRAPRSTTSAPQPRPTPQSPGGSPGDPDDGSTGTTGGPTLLPNTALPPPTATR